MGRGETETRREGKHTDMKRIRPDLRANFGWERFQVQTHGREKLSQESAGQEKVPMRVFFRLPPSFKNSENLFSVGMTATLLLAT